ncbi:MAG: NDP-sugar synthase [Lachnospiraceae bacterium]
MKPVLIIMAAGMGSRYGGLKQIDPIDEQKHIIIDFSIYDAKKAGFDKVVFVIKKEDEQDFKEAIGDRISRQIEVSYVYQDLHNLPKGYLVPMGRTKPWGTGQAILCCRNEIKSSFAVINADDYYGKEAFSELFLFLANSQNRKQNEFAMVGYELGNTVTEHGHVARGICRVSEDMILEEICERTRIEKQNGSIVYSIDEGASYVMLHEKDTVSMNMWGFTESVFEKAEQYFCDFLDLNMMSDPLKAEFFLPDIINKLVKEEGQRVTVLPSRDQWYGVTYKEDKKMVADAIKQLKSDGAYPIHLWEESEQ